MERDEVIVEIKGFLIFKSRVSLQYFISFIFFIQRGRK
jgi:hypothetical protein